MKHAATNGANELTERSVPAPKRRLRKFLRRVAGIAGSLVVVLAALFLCKDTIVTSIVERRIHERTGFTANIGRLKTSFGSLKIVVKDFKLLNPPEFGGRTMFEIPELYMNVDVGQLARGKVHFRELRLDLSELNVIKGREGVVNLKKLEELLAAEPHQPDWFKMRFVYGGIDQCNLSVGRLSYTDLQQASNCCEFALALRDEQAANLQTEQALRSWLGALAFRLMVQESLKTRENPEAGGFEKLLESLRTN